MPPLKALGQQLQGHAVGVDQPPSGLGLGPGEDLLHGAALHQVAVVQNGHVGADLLDDLHVVGDDDHGNAQPVVDVLDQPQNVPGGLGVQGRGGLVAEEQLRVRGQGPGDGDALLLAAGELGGIGVCLTLQVYDL